MGGGDGAGRGGSELEHPMRVVPRPTALVLIALVAAGGALLYALVLRAPQPEPILQPLADVDRPPPEAPGPPPPPLGGVYSGRVLDLEGRPIHGARVLLVGYNAGEFAEPAAVVEGEPPPPAVVGDYFDAGETVTDADGAFRIAADARSRIAHVLAWHKRYFVDGVETRGRPREGLELRLAPAGRVVGRVFDEATGEPVAGARVDIYLQNKTAPPPAIPEGRSVGEQRGTRVPLASLPQLGRFVPQVLGPRVWELSDIPQLGDDSLKLFTNAEGHFEIGPFADSVQLEFVITHPDYKWYDFDSDDGKHVPRRTVVPPGETVERRFPMRPGLEVAGQVLDENERPVPDVEIRVESVSAYYKHPWYKYKLRTGRTDAQGRFRIKGLAIGDQRLEIRHPSFGVRYEQAPGGAENLRIDVDSFGALHAALEGLAPRRGLMRHAEVTVESVEDNPRGDRQVQRRVSLGPDDSTLVERILPGRYRVWARCERLTSQPVEVEIQAHQITRVVLRMGGGGSVALRVLDPEGRFVDPATAQLVVQRDGRGVGLGTFTSREGEFALTDVVPGRYVLEVSAPRFITARTEAFEVREGDHLPLPPLVLRRYAWLRFLAPLDGAGRPFVPGPEEEVWIEWQAGDEAPWNRVRTLQFEVPVPPGPVRIRARAGSGLAFASEFVAADGERRDVQVVLRP